MVFRRWYQGSLDLCWFSTNLCLLYSLDRFYSLCLSEIKLQDMVGISLSTLEAIIGRFFFPHIALARSHSSITPAGWMTNLHHHNPKKMYSNLQKDRVWTIPILKHTVSLFFPSLSNFFYSEIAPICCPQKSIPSVSTSVPSTHILDVGRWASRVFLPEVPPRVTWQ